MLKPGDGPTTNFSALRRLRLSRCVLARPALGMSYPIPQVPFEHIPNLNKLELIECHFRSLYPVKISGDELVDLVIALIMFPSLLEQAESPFKRMDCVEFHNGDYLISNRRIFNALLSYFFNDHVGGTDLFDRFFPRPDASDDSSPKSVVVYKSDLP
ncbi:hypothetical protein LINGRAHAP2_LOCUS3542 [Linum grandiflorum]